MGHGVLVESRSDLLSTGRRLSQSGAPTTGEPPVVPGFREIFVRRHEFMIQCSCFGGRMATSGRRGKTDFPRRVAKNSSHALRTWEALFSVQADV